MGLRIEHRRLPGGKFPSLGDLLPGR
jgi:hypothetical protein